MSELRRRLLPSASCLQKENLGCDVAAAGGVEEEARNLRDGFRTAEIKFFAVVLSKRLGIDTDDARYIRLRNAVCRQGFDLLARGRIGLMRASAHWTLHSAVVRL